MFNDIIVENFSKPRFAMELNENATHIEIGNPVCGDRIRVQVDVDGDQINAARYQAWGCATSLATGNIFCAYVQGKSMSAIQATSEAEMLALLGELDPAQYHCFEMLKLLFEKLAIWHVKLAS